MKYVFTIITLLAFPQAWAQTPAFTNLTDSDVEDVIKDFSANLVHTTVSPASGIGDIFGFELGLVAGAATSPGVERITNQTDPDSEDLDTLPHLALIGIVTFPIGVTGELGLLPSYEKDGVEISSRSFAVKWTFSKLLPSPVDLSMKWHGTGSDLSFKQNQPVADTKIEYEAKTAGILFQVSKSFVIVEPYFGLGFLKSEGEISAPVDIFANSSGTSVKKEITGSQYMLGANLNLGIVKLGLELGKVYDSRKATAKLSFYF